MNKRYTDVETKTPVFQSSELLKGKTEIIIRHGADEYRLKLTKAGKLILNK